MMAIINEPPEELADVEFFETQQETFSIAIPIDLSYYVFISSSEVPCDRSIPLVKTGLLSRPAYALNSPALHGLVSYTANMGSGDVAIADNIGSMFASTMNAILGSYEPAMKKALNTVRMHSPRLAPVMADNACAT